MVRPRDRGITMAKTKVKTAEAEDKLADAKRQGQAQFFAAIKGSDDNANSNSFPLA